MKRLYIALALFCLLTILYFAEQHLVSEKLYDFQIETEKAQALALEGDFLVAYQNGKNALDDLSENIDILNFFIDEDKTEKIFENASRYLEFIIAEKTAEFNAEYSVLRQSVLQALENAKG